MLLIDSDYNRDPKNGSNVNKQVFIKEIKTIVNDQKIIDTNEDIKKEEAQQKARVANNQNATKAGAAAAERARKVAKSTRKKDTLIVATAKPPRIIVTNEQTTKQEAEDRRQKEAEAKVKREAEKAREEAARRQKAEAKATREAKAREEAARRQKEAEAKVKREAEKAKAEEARRQKEEAKAEEINPFEIFTENPIFSFLSKLLSPSSEQKKEQVESPLLPKSSRQEEIKPPHPDDIEVPSLSQVLEERKTAKEQNPAKKRFTDQREAEINAANNPMTFIKKGLKGLYKGITNLFSPEKEAESKASNAPKCTRNTTKEPQGLEGFKYTLKNDNYRARHRIQQKERNARAHIR